MVQVSFLTLFVHVLSVCLLLDKSVFTEHFADVLYCLIKVSVLCNLLISTWQHLCTETLRVKKLVTRVMVGGGGGGIER